MLYESTHNVTMKWSMSIKQQKKNKQETFYHYVIMALLIIVKHQYSQQSALSQDWYSFKFGLSLRKTTKIFDE